MYTSGSTGIPKAWWSSTAACHTTCVVRPSISEATEASASVPSSLSFDLTVTGLYGPLVVRRRRACCRVDSAGHRGAIKTGCTFMKATPSHLALLTMLQVGCSPSQ